MALVLTLKYLESIEGKADRMVKIDFRGYEKSSRIVRGKDMIYLGDRFQWPIGRTLDSTDILHIRVFNYSKYLNNRMIGSLTISLQKLLHEGSLTLRENLVDCNHSIIQPTLSFEIQYFSPDSQAADWRQEHPNDAMEEQYGNLDPMRYPPGDIQDLDAGSVDISETRSLLAIPSATIHENGGFQERFSLCSDDDKESTFSASPKRGIGVPPALVPTLHKLEDYQVAVTIIEARQLAGPNINPCVEVQIGDKTKKTEVKMSTNSPYYNQYLCFEFRMSKTELLDQVIHIRAIAMGNMVISRLLPGDLIGEFRMDVKTVYSAPDHMFYHKWAMLIDPKDVLSSVKGYVKVDINVVGKGEPIKRSKGYIRRQKSHEEEDIEANLLLPQNLKTGKRQMAEICVKIYRAEDLPRMNTDIMATIKQAITGDSKPLVDPYVQVSFAGHAGKTKSKKKTYVPEWNEEIIFTQMFPPLCNRIRISVFDWDAMYNECIATHFIELTTIMNDGDNGFLPTFGPSWVNLYGTPRNYNYEQVIHPREELNRGLGEGVAYRGRLLMAIKTSLKTDSIGLQAGVRVASTQAITDAVTGRREDFLLLGIIYEASVIDSEIGKKKLPLFFELSIGTTGNVLDGHFSDGKDDDSDDNIVLSTNQEENSRPSSATQGVNWCHSTSPAMQPSTNDCEYYHIPYKERKPCLFMRCQHQDHRYRMYIPNILEKLKFDFEQKIDEVADLIGQEKIGAYRRLKQHLDTILLNIEGSQTCVKNCRSAGGKTLLDKERQKLLRIHLEKMKIKVINMRRDCTMENLFTRMREARKLIKSLEELIEEPQHSLPDVFLWLLMDNKRVAFARIPARSILHSSVEEEKGKECAKVVTLFLRKPGRKGMGQSGWTLQGQVKMYLWLGLVKEMKAYKANVLDGYDENTFKMMKPPKEIVYLGKCTFQFRAHMFMARNLIGSDETGLSDAFARIIINEHVITTKVIYETLSPKWDQTLIVESMTFYLKREAIKENPPVIIVEVFDEDTIDGFISQVGVMGTQSGRSEFLGRCFCKPTIIVYDDEYKTPKLDWWEIYRGQTNAGELLATFELIEIDPEDKQVALNAPSIDTLKEGMPEEAIAAAKTICPSSVVRTEGTLAAATNWSTSFGTAMSRQPPKPFLHHHNIVLPVPTQIRPKLCPYRVEVFFWGVRELHRIQFMAVDRPKITIEFGGEHLSSETIQNARLKPNFSQPTKYIDLMLPENERYWPPLLIQCEDCRQFGRTILVGNHVISSVTKYILRPKSSNDQKYRSLRSNSSQARFATDDIAGNLSSSMPGQPGSGNSAQLVGTQMFAEARSLANHASTLKSKSPTIVAKSAAAISSHFSKKISTTSSPVPFHSPSHSQIMRPVSVPSHSAIIQSQDNVQILNQFARTNSQPAGSPIMVPLGGNDESERMSTHVELREKEALFFQNDNYITTKTEVVEVNQQKALADLQSSSHPPGSVAGSKAESNKRSTLQRVDEVKPPGALLEMKKRPKIPKEDMEDIDWWSRFYASVEDSEEKTGDSESDSDGVDPLEDIMVDMKSEADDKTGLLEIPELDEDDADSKGKGKKKKKSKKEKKEEKKKKKKKARLSKLRLGKKDASKRFLEEKHEDLEDLGTPIEDNSWIERLMVYSCPLEEVKEFNGFHSFTKTYPLYKGKQEDDDEPPENRIVGHFKGNILIYKIDDSEFGKEIDVTTLSLNRDLPSNDPVTLLVRIYVIRAIDLHPTDPNGKSDPYLILRLGSKVINDKDNYIPKQLNPVFGKCFELEAKFPQESMLTIQVMDWDLLSGDDVIGETKIDLENRYYSKHRALCGIASAFDIKGYNKWRDQLSPTQILMRMCKEHLMEMPIYETTLSKVSLEGHVFYADTEVENENGEVRHSNEPLALEVLKNWHKFSKGTFLVPEHVESRPLFNPEKVGIEQGHLEMWVDMFPKELGAPPSQVDISPRIPKSFQLRVIVWDTEDVILNDDAMLTGEKSSDIFVKGWMKGLGIDDQVTDVHYRSLSGEGNFNWRFVFNFDYLKSEDKIVYKTKESPFSIDETEFKAPCKLFLQVWDADIVSADDFLGGLELLLSKIPRGAKFSRSCGIHQLSKDGSVPVFSMFRNRRCRGWWPFIAESEDDPNELEVTGKIDAELHLLTIEEADQNQAGLGREDPNGLSPPKRPDGSFLSFMNPLKTLKYLICKRYKWLIIKVSILLALLALLVLFIYNSPGYLAKKIIGA